MSIVQFVVDEAASLGHLEPISDMVAIGRGYGIRLILIYQSLGQLKRCFPDGQDQTLVGNVTSIFFGVNDNATAEYVSNRIGESTIVVESGGTSDGSSNQWTQSGMPNSSKSHSHNSSSNYQPQARKLLKPEEVMQLPPRTAITFAPNVPPICTKLLRYYEEPKSFGRKIGWFSNATAACHMVAASVLFFVMSLVIAAALTQAVNEKSALQGNWDQNSSTARTY